MTGLFTECSQMFSEFKKITEKYILLFGSFFLLCNNTRQMSTVQILIKTLSPNATIPSKGSPGAAGYDLYAAQDCVIPSHGLFLVPTDLSIAIVDQNGWSHSAYYGRVAPRSGLACKYIDVGAGVIGNAINAIEHLLY